jgi:hypothetical protein
MAAHPPLHAAALLDILIESRGDARRSVRIGVVRAGVPPFCWWVAESPRKGRRLMVSFPCPLNAIRVASRRWRGGACLFLLAGVLSAASRPLPAQSAGAAAPVSIAETLQDQPTTATVIQINLDPSGGVLVPDGPFAFDPSSQPPFDIVPPLSVYESRLMLRNAQVQLHENSSETFAARAPRVDFMLESVAHYIRWIDEIHTTLPYYSWRDLADVKIRLATWRSYAFRPPTLVRGVTAIALRAHHSDVEIQQIAVIDRDRRQWQFTQPIALRGDQPRSEICFLPLPTEIVEIRVRCRQAESDEEHRPRLFIQTGVCARPETAKQAVYHIRRARFELRQGRLAEVDRNLDLAGRCLLEYQKDRRL